MFERFKPKPVYVVRSRSGDSRNHYLAYSDCLKERGYNVTHKLREAKRCETINRARKDGKKWFIHEGYEIRRLRCFGLFSTIVEVYFGM